MRLVLKTLVFLTFMSPLSDVFGCTVFTATNKNTTLVGNNEDMFNAKTRVEFYSPADGKYERVFFGFGRNPHQGGMNEKGLFFDCVATPPLKDALPKTKPECPGDLLDKALEQCATIQEVLDLFEQYDTTYMNSYMTILVDASGDGFVTQGGIIDRKKTASVAIGRGWKAAYRRLEEASEISVDLFRSIASEVHVEGVVKTLYSNVYDLKNRVVYLYYYYDFENPLRIDLQDHLKKKGTCIHHLGNLFPEREAQIKRRYQVAREDKLKSAVKLDPMIFEQYIGTYFGQGVDIDVARVDDKYEIRFLGTGPYELVPLSQRAFAVVDVESNAQIEFVKEKGEKTFQLAADLDGWKFKADRHSN